MSKGVNPGYVQGVMRMSKGAESVSRREYPKEYIPGKVQRGRGYVQRSRGFFQRDRKSDQGCIYSISKGGGVCPIEVYQECNSKDVWGISKDYGYVLRSMLKGLNPA